MAVLRLRTSSNLADWTTGRSAGRSPFQDAADVVAGLPIGVCKVSAVAHESARSAEVAQMVRCWSAYFAARATIWLRRLLNKGSFVVNSASTRS